MDIKDINQEINRQIKHNFDKNEKGQFVDQNGQPLKNRTVPFIIGLVIFIILGIFAFIYHVKHTVAEQRANYYIVQHDTFCERDRQNLIYAFMKGDNENSPNVQAIFQKANTFHCLILRAKPGIGAGIHYEKSSNKFFYKP